MSQSEPGLSLCVVCTTLPWLSESTVAQLIISQPFIASRYSSLFRAADSYNFDLSNLSADEFAAELKVVVLMLYTSYLSSFLEETNIVPTEKCVWKSVPSCRDI